MSETIKIMYVGSAGERTMGDYTWNAENGFTQAVDLETAANLIAYPHPQFAVVAGQRVSAADRKRLAELLGVSEDDVKETFTLGVVVKSPTVPEITGEMRAAELAAQGVATVADLAKLNDEGIEKLATNTGASRAEIQAWVEQAKQAEAK